MAQDTQPPSGDESTKSDQSQIPADDDGQFHYYSGGEVKELAATKVSPILWAFWSILIVVLLIFFFVSGARGPQYGKPLVRQMGDQQQTDIAGLQSDISAQYPSISTADFVVDNIKRPQGQTAQQAIDAGSDVYQNNCIGCHGPNQDGNGINAASLNPKPRNLHDAPFMQAMSYQRISTSIHKGVPGTAMPRWENVLTENQIQDVIVYVLSLTVPNSQVSGDTAMSPNITTGSGSTATVSPTPITPAVNGNPAASTSTAPPSSSGSPIRKAGTAHKLKPAAPGM